MRVILAIALAGCGGPGTPSPQTGLVLPHDLVGCYVVREGVHLGLGTRTVRFDSTPAPAELRSALGDSAWMATFLDADGRAISPEGGWPKLSWFPHSPPDSVRLLYGHGWGGAQLTIQARARDDTLRGRAVIVNDHDPRFEDGGPATLVPVQCPSPSSTL